VILNLYAKKSDESNGEILETVCHNVASYLGLFPIFVGLLLYEDFQHNPLSALWMLLVICSCWGLSLGIYLAIKFDRNARNGKAFRRWKDLHVIVVDDTSPRENLFDSVGFILTDTLKRLEEFVLHPLSTFQTIHGQEQSMNYFEMSLDVIPSNRRETVAQKNSEDTFETKGKTIERAMLPESLLKTAYQYPLYKEMMKCLEKKREEELSSDVDLSILES